MKFIFFLYRQILKLRYEITIKGSENLKNSGPLLVLPNHIALVDPQIIVSFLYKYIKIGPVMSQDFYEMPIMKHFFKAMGAVPIGDLEVGKGTEEEIKQSFLSITNHLVENKNILIYPAGMIKAQGKESIIGKQAVYNIVKLMPKNTKVIGVKMNGLWGSRLSRAWEGKTPNIVVAMLFGIAVIILNFIFFVPKRKVSVEIEDITDMVNEKLEKLNEFNKALENFYNVNGEEEMRFIRHFFYYDDVKDRKAPEVIKGSIDELSKIRILDEKDVPQDIKNIIIEKIVEMKGVKKEELNLNSKLILDCLCDSLDLAELKSFTQMSFSGSSNPSILDLKTVGDLCLMAMGKLQNEKLKPCKWNEIDENESCLTELKDIKNKKIIDLYFKMLKKYENDTWSYDNMLGNQTYSDFHTKSTILAAKIKEKIRGEYVGIMLPSLTLTSSAIIATYLAGKIPVMINWTLPKSAFEHCIKFAGIENILTSFNFFEKVKNDTLDEYKDKMVFLEDCLKNLSLFEKISGIAQAKLKSYVRNKSETAVLLFTSGSEALPKAVSLTHENVISCLKGAMELFPLTKKEKIISFLPPFHSFGFTINTILPLITGLRVINTPDPNDAGTIISLIKHTSATTITATPTFLKMIMAQAGEKDMEKVNYAVVGAEKCTQEVANAFSKLCPHGTILEGYGITECSPVVSINPYDKPKLGSIGKVISNLEMRIIDLETQKDADIGKQGMIYVRGSSVFSGYLDKNLESPFEIIDSKEYYKTGDLGYIDEEGYVFITGRLKRFVKIAGEMISLPYIEGVLLEKYSSAETVEIALEALEENGIVKMVLFSINKLDVDEVNSYLREKGVNNLARMNEVRLIESIPVLGTGKIDYKTLKKMI